MSMMLMVLLSIVIVYLLIGSLAPIQKNMLMQKSYTPKDCHNGNIDVVLEIVDNDKKNAALKELRLLLNQDLKTCKYIIESAPIVILKNISDEQVKSLQEKFNYIGVNISFKNN